MCFLFYYYYLCVRTLTYGGLYVEVREQLLNRYIFLECSLTLVREKAAFTLCNLQGQQKGHFIVATHSWPLNPCSAELPSGCVPSYEARTSLILQTKLVGVAYFSFASEVL